LQATSDQRQVAVSIKELDKLRSKMKKEQNPMSNVTSKTITGKER
jgi:hypothetical protein